MEEAKPLLPSNVEYCDAIYDVFDDVDAVILFTEWHVYRGLDISLIKEKMSGNTFIDLRNVYEPDTMKANGFNYVCVGRQ